MDPNRLYTGTFWGFLFRQVGKKESHLFIV